MSELKTPLISRLIIKLKQILFPGSRDYWETRYQAGGKSGKGSTGKLAKFKAEVINDFVQRQGVKTVIEFGCGDGHQLECAHYPQYIGVDVSQTAVANCTDQFKDDPNKSFFLYDSFCDQGDIEKNKADLALSLDVIYHLVEDEVYHDYMKNLFRAARRYVIVYSSNVENKGRFYARHLRHRNFTKLIDEQFPEWTLIRKVDNKYPWDGEFGEGSFADFYIFENRQGTSRADFSG